MKVKEIKKIVYDIVKRREFEQKRDKEAFEYMLDNPKDHRKK